MVSKLSLPAFEEIRHDKKATGANTFAEVQATVEAAKQGK